MKLGNPLCWMTQETVPLGSTRASPLPPNSAVPSRKKRTPPLVVLSGTGLAGLLVAAPSPRFLEALAFNFSALAADFSARALRTRAFSAKFCARASLSFARFMRFFGDWAPTFPFAFSFCFLCALCLTHLDTLQSTEILRARLHFFFVFFLLI